MKKITGILVFLILLSLATLAYGQINTNVIKINNTNYRIISAELHYYGNIYSKNEVNIDLYIELSNDAELYFEMFVPNGNERLVAGTYTLSDKNTQFTFSDESYVDVNYDDHEITGGTLVVTTSGAGSNAVYTIVIDCTYKVGNATRSISGVYQGTPDWFD